MWRRLSYRVSLLLFLSYFSCFREVISTAIVTLQSVEIFTTHELLASEPTVYFNCKGEKKIILPDLKKTHFLYAFRGEESWQPLTEFPNKKCKRCGFYAKHTIKSDDVFGEWEFCPSDFTSPDGKYIHSIDKELNATFLCKDCVPYGADSKHDAKSENRGGLHWAIVVLISVLASILMILALAAAYKYWQKKKRQKDQARFLKLFEEGDDIEDELGIGPLGGSV